MIHALCFLATMMAQTQGADFETELPPGGRYLRYTWATVSPELRAEPNHSSAVVKTLRGVWGRLIEYDSVRARMIAPGRVVALRETQLTGRDFGEARTISRSSYYRVQHPSVVRPAAAGDTLVYLQYRAEGTCFVRMSTTVIEAQPCPTERHADWKTLRDATTELWIRVTSLGEPLGWILTGPSVTSVYESRQQWAG